MDQPIAGPSGEMERPGSQAQALPEKPSAVQFSTQQQNEDQNKNIGHQQQFQPLELPKAERFKPSKPFSVGKVTLASFNFVFAIVTLGISIGFASQAWSFDSFLGVIIGACASAVSIVWQLAEYITMLSRRSLYRPIHPGAHVGVHLVLTILCILVTGSLAISLAYGLADWTVDSACGAGAGPGYYNDDGRGRVYCGYDTFASEADAGRYFGLLEALVAFAALMAVAHFALAVLACVETDRRRKHGRRTKVVYLVAPADGGGAYFAPAPPPAPAPAPGRPSAAAAETYGYYAPEPAASPARQGEP